jgi:hypothetical protein
MGVTPSGQRHQLEVALDTFTAQALHAESERLGVSRQELVTFAIAYYLADLDSGRIARRITAPERHPSPPGPS